MRAPIFAAALLAACAVPALAQTPPGEHPPTGRVEQSVPPMKSDQPSSGGTGAVAGEQKGM
jgi:hypothetical protein